MNKGTILLVTLWILAILSLLAIGIGFRTAVELKLIGYQMNSLKAYEIAKAGVVKAIDELERDETPDTDTIWACGITLKPLETPEGKFKDIKVGEGRFEVSYTGAAGRKVYGAEDMQAIININSVAKEDASRRVLLNLSDQMTEDIVNNIRAWRGDIAAGPGDYTDKPYLCKGAPFDTINELLLVKDITGEIFSGGGEAGGIKDVIAAYDPSAQLQFKVNINTAPEKVLAALGLYSEDVQKILVYREGVDKDINLIQDNQFFRDENDVQSAGLDIKSESVSRALNFCGYNSNYFRITSTGTLDSRKPVVKKTITCIVKREISATPPHKIQIIGWSE